LTFSRLRPSTPSAASLPSCSREGVGGEGPLVAENHRRERLVQLDRVEILQTQPRLVEQFAHGERRAEAHPRRVAAGAGIGAQVAQRPSALGAGRLAGRQGDVAEHDLIHLIRAHSGALQDRRGGDAAEFPRRHGRRRAERLGDGRADAFENGDVRHGFPSKATDSSGKRIVMLVPFGSGMI
jgi:hypothetical protein